VDRSPLGCGLDDGDSIHDRKRSIGLTRFCASGSDTMRVVLPIEIAAEREETGTKPGLNASGVVLNRSRVDTQCHVDLGDHCVRLL
jgi:hypothetical protein